MSQHFLLTATARSLSLGQVLRLSAEEAHAKLVEIRWSDNNGQPYCPHCGCADVYGFRCRPIWRCKGCNKQFSVTSGTMFHGRKLPHRDYLAAIAIFVSGAKGVLQLMPVQDGFRPGAQAARGCFKPQSDAESEPDQEEF